MPLDIPRGLHSVGSLLFYRSCFLRLLCVVTFLSFENSKSCGLFRRAARLVIEVIGFPTSLVVLLSTSLSAFALRGRDKTESEPNLNYGGVTLLVPSFRVARQMLSGVCNVFSRKPSG